MKKLIYSLALIALFSSSQVRAVLENELKDDPLLLTIAQRVIDEQAILQEKPFDWREAFNLKESTDFQRAQRLSKVLEDYFAPKIQALFSAKSGFNRSHPEWHRVNDEYDHLVRYKNQFSSDSLWSAFSATYGTATYAPGTQYN